MNEEEFRKMHLFGDDFVVFEKRKYFYVWKANGAIPSDVTRPCNLPGFAKNLTRRLERRLTEGGVGNGEDCS